MQGGGGGGASAAAEWDDRGEHDTTGFGCSSTHLLVPVFSRHAGGGDCGASGCVSTEAAVEAASEVAVEAGGGLLVLAFCASSR